MYFFSIPDSDDVRALNCIVLTMFQQKKDWFYDDFTVETAYGCPPACVWNGNRGADGAYYYPKKWKEIIEMYSHLKIKYRLTFTNFLLRPEHLFDTYANKIAEILNAYGGFVMVSRPLMEFYIRQTYPNLKVCWSTTTDFGKTPEEQIKKINELSADTLVVPPLDFKSFIPLERFEHPENIEVIVNEYCRDNCPKRVQHWTDVNQCIIMEYRGTRAVGCFFPEMYGGTEKKNINVLREDFPAYVLKGIVHFKISGRIDPTQTARAYTEYFVRPEYRQEFFNLVTKYVEF